MDRSSPLQLPNLSKNCTFFTKRPKYVRHKYSLNVSIIFDWLLHEASFQIDVSNGWIKSSARHPSLTNDGLTYVFGTIWLHCAVISCTSVNSNFMALSWVISTSSASNLTAEFWCILISAARIILYIVIVITWPSSYVPHVSTLFLSSLRPNLPPSSFFSFDSILF